MQSAWWRFCSEAHSAHFIKDFLASVSLAARRCAACFGTLDPQLCCRLAHGYRIENIEQLHCVFATRSSLQLFILLFSSDNSGVCLWTQFATVNFLTIAVKTIAKANIAVHTVPSAHITPA